MLAFLFANRLPTSGDRFRRGRGINGSLYKSHLNYMSEFKMWRSRMLLDGRNT